MTKSFTINPKGTTITSVKKITKGFKVTWKKSTTQVTGYQLRWSLKKSMANPTLKTITSNKTTTFKKTGLKAGKTYYIQIRTYKTVDGKKYYSKWSGK